MSCQRLRYIPAAVLFAVLNSVFMPSRLEVTLMLRNLNNLNAAQNLEWILIIHGVDRVSFSQYLHCV